MSDAPSEIPSEYVVAHVVAALAEDDRTHELGIEVIVHEHEVRLSGCLSSASQRDHVLEVVALTAPECRLLDDLVVCDPATTVVSEEEL